MLRLQWRDGNLTFTPPDTPVWRLTIESTADRDVFTASPGSAFAGDTITFRRQADGRITSVHVMDSTPSCDWIRRHDMNDVSPQAPAPPTVNRRAGLAQSR
jgi:hypothetical protein